MESLAVPISDQTKTLISAKPIENKNKYSFLEIMVIISAIAVIGVLGLLAINPSKQGADTRNLQRKADTSYILSEISTYTRAGGVIPDVIPVTNECVVFGNEICRIGPYDCEDFVNLGILNNPDSDKVVSIPTDPLYFSINGTGYYIYQNGQGAVTVCAPYAERNEVISFTKYLY